MKKSLDSKHLSGNHPDVVPESTRVAQNVIDVKFYVVFGVNSDIREIFIVLFFARLQNKYSLLTL